MGQCTILQSKLYERLKELRKNAGYSYKKLEELTGISRSTLQRYETNPLADIPLNKLTILASIYNVTISYLLGTEDKNMPYEYFESLSPLLKELNCKIQYDEHAKTYELLIQDNQHEDLFHAFSITNEQIKNLKDTTLSYLSFKINELVCSSKSLFTE